MIDRNRFERAVRLHGAEFRAKRFRCWDQFVAMLFCRMAGANSLREICGGLVTDGKTHDVKAAQGLSFEPGTIVAMDRGYVDYGLFARWTEEGVFFVTRKKDKMACRVVERGAVPKGGDILWDNTVVLTGQASAEKCPHRLRIVGVWDPEKRRAVEFVTNIFHLAASTVAAIYKERWQIESFFKALKQNLKAETFVGTIENAVKTQIWTALIAMVLLKRMQLRSKREWSLSNLAALLRLNLLTRRDLWAWLEFPFETPVEEPPAKQLTLFPM